jgi:hypothetical protein
MRQHVSTALIAFALAVSVTALGAALGPELPRAHARGVHDLVGRKAGVRLGPGANDVESIEDLIGVISKEDERGLWLQAEQRTVVVRGSRSQQPYDASVFVPWTSVLYVRLMP